MIVVEGCREAGWFWLRHEKAMLHGDPANLLLVASFEKLVFKHLEPKWQWLFYFCFSTINCFYMYIYIYTHYSLSVFIYLYVLSIVYH